MTGQRSVPPGDEVTWAIRTELHRLDRDTRRSARRASPTRGTTVEPQARGRTSARGSAAGTTGARRGGTDRRSPRAREGVRRGNPPRGDRRGEAQGVVPPAPSTPFPTSDRSAKISTGGVTSRRRTRPRSLSSPRRAPRPEPGLVELRIRGGPGTALDAGPGHPLGRRRPPACLSPDRGVPSSAAPAAGDQRDPGDATGDQDLPAAATPPGRGFPHPARPPPPVGAAQSGLCRRCATASSKWGRSA